MAEILLSLTIIGVVATITLPSLTGNINERTWNTQRKALYARMSQAIALMPALNGYGMFTEGDASTSTVDTAAETFVTDGLSKVLKINNICDSDHLADCGIPAKITDFKGGTMSFPATLVDLNPMFSGSYQDPWSRSYSYNQENTKAVAFETQNGESIAVFYNPLCKSGGLGEYVQSEMCANFVYDLNGNKGPNTVGKDIGFITALHPVDPIVVAPVYTAQSPEHTTVRGMIEYCRSINDSRVPNIDELKSIFYNKSLLAFFEGGGGHIVSSTQVNINKEWYVYSMQTNVGYIVTNKRADEGSLGGICIAR